MGKLKGQTAVVTGAASGIGKAIASKLAHEGAHVYITDINGETGAQAVQEIRDAGCRADFLELDVRDAKAVTATIDNVFEETGRMDILVNNAGIPGNPASVELLSDDEWKLMFDIHVNGSFYGLKAAAHHMKKQGYGRIIMMSSLASETSLRGFAHYAAVKYALLGLTESSAKDLAAYGITVNAIKPGVIRSALTGGILSVAEKSLAQSTPVGKIGSPNDVAEAAAFLASPDSSFITGTSIIVDGGFRLVNEMDQVIDQMLTTVNN